MRNAVTLGVSHYRLDAIRRDFKLFGDFRDADAVVKVVNDRRDRHSRATHPRSATLYFRLGFD